MIQVFRPAALEELFLLDDLMVESLITDFKEFAPKALAQIQKSMTDSDFKQLEIVSHSLKSSCFTLGFDQAGDYCYKIEVSASEKQKGPNNIDTLSASIFEALREIDKFMSARVN